MSLYASRSDGILQERESTSPGLRTFDNARFVETISGDSSPWGAMMSTLHPTPLTISVKAPSTTWETWSEEIVDLEIAAGLVDALPEEIPAAERLRIGRKGLSTRSTEILTLADMSVTPRGVADAGTPVTAEKALAGLVYQAYYLVERNTTASLKSAGSRLSSLRRGKFSSVVDILTGEENILGVTLLSTYTEPSLTMIRRFFYVATIVGVERAHEMLDDLYRRRCAEQREAVLAIAGSVL